MMINGSLETFGIGHSDTAPRGRAAAAGDAARSTGANGAFAQVMGAARKAEERAQRAAEGPPASESEDQADGAVDTADEPTPDDGMTTAADTEANGTHGRLPGRQGAGASNHDATRRLSPQPAQTDAPRPATNPALAAEHHETARERLPGGDATPVPGAERPLPDNRPTAVREPPQETPQGTPEKAGPAPGDTAPPRHGLSPQAPDGAWHAAEWQIRGLAISPAVTAAGTSGAQTHAAPDTPRHPAAGARDGRAAAPPAAARDTSQYAVRPQTAPQDMAAGTIPPPPTRIPAENERAFVLADRLPLAGAPPMDDAAMPAPGAAAQATAQATGPDNAFSVTGSGSERQVLRQVAGQMAVAVQNAGGGQVTLQLAPVELGRVDITLQTRDQGLSLLIVADRPETLDLMRRHVDQLADDLHALGFGSLDLQFRQNGQNGEGGGDSGEAQAGPMASTDPGPALPAMPAGQLAQTGRLDLRF